MTNNNLKDKKNSLKKIEELYNLMLEQEIEELELKDQLYYIKLKRKSKKKNISDNILHQTQGQLTVVPSVSKKELTNTSTIKSPLNGIFYRASSPSSKPYVKEGDVVEAGKVLCIIEAMKVMNEIHSEFKCKILKILVDNGESVKTNQDIFEVEKM